MTVLRAKQLRDAIAKVQRVGRIEESVRILNTDIVLQNLSATETKDAVDECAELEDLAYLTAVQMAQVSRAIMQIDDIDLHGVDYVEEDVPAGHFLVQISVPSKAAADAAAAKMKAEFKLTATVSPVGTETKTVKVERYVWVRDNIIRDWSAQALAVAWRKHTELISKSDQQAKEGVVFKIPDKTDEDKYRELLADLREAGENLPTELTDKLLEEFGLMSRTSQEELEDVAVRMAELQAEDEALLQDQDSPHDTSPRVAPAEVPAAVQAAMATRARLNEEAPPVPMPQQATQNATPRVPVPEHIRNSAVVMPGRSAQIAEMEKLDFPEVLSTSDVSQPPVAAEHPPLAIDARPAGGLNPKYRPRNR